MRSKGVEHRLCHPTAGPPRSSVNPGKRLIYREVARFPRHLDLGLLDKVSGDQKHLWKNCSLEQDTQSLAHTWPRRRRPILFAEACPVPQVSMWDSCDRGKVKRACTPLREDVALPILTVVHAGLACRRRWRIAHASPLPTTAELEYIGAYSRVVDASTRGQWLHTCGSAHVIFRLAPFTRAAIPFRLCFAMKRPNSRPACRRARALPSLSPSLLRAPRAE